MGKVLRKTKNGGRKVAKREDSKIKDGSDTPQQKK